MLQLQKAGVQAQENLFKMRDYPPRWQNMADLEATANRWLTDFLSERRRCARTQGLLSKLADAFDRWLRTDRPEHIDDPEFPAKGKLKIINALHRLNRMILSYERYTRILEPLIHETAAHVKRPVRLLELGSGSGEFTFTLARLARERGLPVEVTGSDYLAEYVEASNKKAGTMGVNVRFHLVNAFNMQAVIQDSYDIILISQSMHHFTPGQIAMMIAQSRTIATTAFVGIDGHRGLLFFIFVPIIVWFMTFSRDIMHDTILSGRKAYSEIELQLIARIAAPDANITVRESFPGVSVMDIRFQRSECI